MSKTTEANEDLKKGDLEPGIALSLFYDRMNAYLKQINSKQEKKFKEMPKDYLKDYAEAKNDFLFPTIFKDRFTYEKKISINVATDDILQMCAENLIEDERKKEIYDSYRKAIRNLCETLLEKISIDGTWSDEDLTGLLLRVMYNLETTWHDSSTCNIDYLMSSLDDKSRKITYPTPEGGIKSITLSRKEKCSKVINKIITLLEKSGTINAQEASSYKNCVDQIGGYSSQLKDSTTLEGTLCISIDPFEFLTCSDNSNNWTSCFSLASQGCNYIHPLAMLTAHNVFIAYLKNDKPYLLDANKPATPDNITDNKLLRAWVFADEETITVDKNYPIQNETFNKEIVKFVNELTDNYYCVDVSEKNHSAELNLQVAYDDGPCKLMATTENFKEGNSKSYSYNPRDCAYCFGCGNQISCGEEYYDDNGFWCDTCLDIYECGSCGERYHRDSLIERENGDLICPECYDELEESEREGDAVGISEDNYD